MQSPWLPCGKLSPAQNRFTNATDKIFTKLTSMIVIGKREMWCVATDDERQFNVSRDDNSRWFRLSSCKQRTRSIIPAMSPQNLKFVSLPNFSQISNMTRVCLVHKKKDTLIRWKCGATKGCWQCLGLSTKLMTGYYNSIVIQDRTVQYRTGQDTTVQYNTVQYRTRQYSTIQYRTKQ